jgi:hypothetical protein
MLHGIDDCLHRHDPPVDDARPHREPDEAQVCEGARVRPTGGRRRGSRRCPRSSPRTRAGSAATSSRRATRASAGRRGERRSRIRRARGEEAGHDGFPSEASCMIHPRGDTEGALSRGVGVADGKTTDTRHIRRISRSEPCPGRCRTAAGTRCRPRIHSYDPTRNQQGRARTQGPRRDLRARGSRTSLACCRSSGRGRKGSGADIWSRPRLCRHPDEMCRLRLSLTKCAA